MSVLVIGGTGTIGSQVLNRLTHMGVESSCLSRHADKLKKLAPGVNGHVGDLLRLFSLERGFKGVEKLFLISPISRTETKEGLNAIEAAKAAGVKKIVYISMPKHEGTDKVPQFRNKAPIEAALKDSGIAYTIIRPYNLFQNDHWGRAAISLYDVYPQPIGNIGINRVNVHDVADAAINALLDDKFNQGDYALHSNEVLTGDSIAAIYTKHFGKTINYAGDDLESWANQAQHMMPSWMVQEFKIMYTYIQEKGLIAPTEDAKRQEELIGHPPSSFDDFVAELAKTWKD